LRFTSRCGEDKVPAYATHLGRGINNAVKGGFKVDKANEQCHTPARTGTALRGLMQISLYHFRANDGSSANCAVSGICSDSRRDEFSNRPELYYRSTERPLHHIYNILCSHLPSRRSICYWRLHQTAGKRPSGQSQDASLGAGELPKDATKVEFKSVWGNTKHAEADAA